LRYFFEIAFKGSAYHGWQIQKNALSVQEVINNTLSQLVGHPVVSTGSARTDTGVHAEQLFFHVDLEKSIRKDTFLSKVNKMLPWDILLKNISLVQDDLNARYDAIQRSYDYRILTYKDPFLEGQYYYYSRSLDLEQMNKAAAILLKCKNFKSFSRVKTSVNHFECKLTRAEWVKENGRLTFFVSANRFLRGMVRAMVGTLLEVGLGRITVQEFRKILADQDRRRAARSVPAQGLFLTEIRYPFNI